MENMDELSARLSQLLDNPEEMEKIRTMAEGLLGGSDKKENQDSGNDLFGSLGAGDIETIMQLGNLLRSDTEDNRTRLLMALKPHLSEKRQDRVDRAVKLLRIASILPLISKSGLF